MDGRTIRIGFITAMKCVDRPWLSLAPPSLIVLVTFALFHRHGSDNMKPLLVLLVAAGLIVHNSVYRARRLQLMMELRFCDQEES